MKCAQDQCLVAIVEQTRSDREGFIQKICQCTCTIKCMIVRVQVDRMTRCLYVLPALSSQVIYDPWPNHWPDVTTLTVTSVTSSQPDPYNTERHRHKSWRAVIVPMVSWRFGTDYSGSAKVSGGCCTPKPDRTSRRWLECCVPSHSRRDALPAKILGKQSWPQWDDLG